MPSLRVFTRLLPFPSSLGSKQILGVCLCSDERAPHCPWACVKFFLSHLEEKPDCSKARCEVQFSPRCPEDSVLIEGYAPPGECCPLPSRCVCDPAGCLRKVCQPGYLNILVSKASGKPGECCDLYECKPGMHELCLSILAPLHQRVAGPSQLAQPLLPCEEERCHQHTASLPLWANGSLTSGLLVREPE